MPRFSSSSERQALVTLKQKKKSLADAVNEQLTASALGSALGGGDRDEYADGGVAEDFDFDDDDYDYGKAKAGGTTGGVAVRGTKGLKKTNAAVSSSSSSRLRHRGPLDASLSEGKYAATPVSVEAAMDDIFGALDMGDMDAEGEEFFDDDNNNDAVEEQGEARDFDVEAGSDSSEAEAGGAQKQKKAAATRKRRRAKDLTEEEYTAWLEKKSEKEKQSGKLRRPLSFSSIGGVGGMSDAVVSSEEADILRQLHELRQTQHVDLVASTKAAATSGTSGVSSAAATAEQSDAKTTRDTVHHFIMVYGQLLRLRVLLQPAVTRAISMPQYYARSLFTQRDVDVEKAALAAAAANAAEGRHVVEQLAEQREAAKEKYKELQASIEDALATLYAAATGTSAAATAEADDGDEVTGVSGSSTVRKSAKRAKVEAAAPVVPSYRAVEKYHERALHHADSCLEYWGSKLVQANSAKLKTISQPLPQQIAAILTARTRLRTKVQKNRSHLNILAHPEHVRASTSPEVKARRALHIAEGDVDAEVYDDGDFVRELVRRGGAVASQLEQKVKEMRQALLPSREGARKGFHRMTKGKAVNYEPRPKLVGFMMAESLDDTPRNDVVVKSLFQ